MEKTDFKQYVALSIEVRQLREQLDALCDPKGAKFSSDPRGPASPGSAAMVSILSARAALEQKSLAALAEKEAQQLRIEQAIMSLDDASERLVMRALYIEGKKWPVVIRELTKKGYSERTLFRLHGTALLKLKEF